MVNICEMLFRAMIYCICNNEEPFRLRVDSHICISYQLT